MTDLEEEKVEEAKPTTEKQVAEPTESEEKPTVSITETPEFRQALDKALGKGLESINRQLSMQKTEADKYRTEAESYKADVAAIQGELSDLQKLHDELAEKQFADDPEARRAYADKRAIAEERRKVAKAMAEAEGKLYEAEQLAWSARMSSKADALVAEIGIDRAELSECATEEEMEVKALRYKMAKEAEGKTEEKPPKFDSGVPSGGGTDWRTLSADEKIMQGLSRKPKGR